MNKRVRAILFFLVMSSAISTAYLNCSSNGPNMNPMELDSASSLSKNTNGEYCVRERDFSGTIKGLALDTKIHSSYAMVINNPATQSTKPSTWVTLTATNECLTAESFKNGSFCKASQTCQPEKKSVINISLNCDLESDRAATCAHLENIVNQTIDLADKNFEDVVPMMSVTQTDIECDENHKPYFKTDLNYSFPAFPKPRMGKYKIIYSGGDLKEGGLVEIELDNVVLETTTGQEVILNGRYSGSIMNQSACSF
jgi:hypothetical protein